MDNRLIPFALVNNKVKDVNFIYRQDTAYCLECKEELILKNGDVNIKHLSHKPNSNCVYKNEKEYKKRGNGESYEHKYAKEFIRDNLKYFRQYGHKIIIKDGEFKLGGYRDLKINKIELECKNLKNELNLIKNYIPDILIRTDVCFICIEIFKSNKKNEIDLKNILKDKNIFVYEVDIRKMNNLNIKDIFKNMKLVFSDLKCDFDNAINPIQANIIENKKIKNNYDSLKNDYEKAKNDLSNKAEIIEELKDNNNELMKEIRFIKIKEKDNLNNFKVKRLESKISNLKKIIKEDTICRTACVKGWYSNKLNLLIDEDIKKCEKNTDEHNILLRFKRFFNGKVGSYTSYGGNEKLKEIADISKRYNSYKKYLGTDNNLFKEAVGMNIDEGVEILKAIVSEDILEVIGTNNE